MDKFRLDYKYKFMRVDGLHNLNNPLNYSFSRCDIGVRHSSNKEYYKGFGATDFPTEFKLHDIFNKFSNIVFEDTVEDLPSYLYEKLKDLAPYMYYSGELDKVSLLETNTDIQFKGYHKIYIDKIEEVPTCKRTVIWHNGNIDCSQITSKLDGEIELHRNCNSPAQDKEKFEEIHNEILQLQYDRLYINQHDAVLGNYTQTTGDVFFDILNNKKRLYSNYEDDYFKEVSSDLIVNQDYNFIPKILAVGVNIPYALLEGYKITEYGLLKGSSSNIKPIIQWKSLL